MKKYPVYKRIGVKWVVEIPNHWEIWKIKHTSYVKGRIGWDGLRSDEFFENEYSFLVTGTDFIKGQVKWETCYQITKERYLQDKYIQLKEDDLLITKDGTIGKTAVVKNLKGYASLNSGVFVVRSLRKYKSNFLYYVLNSNVFTKFIELTTTGTTILHLYQNIFEIFEFPIPPILEQLTIVKFLDYKTDQIDRFIAARQKQIELLKEQKSGIINKAVTKGINSNAKMKTSGIEWIGEIPENWKILKLKYVLKICNGAGLLSELIKDEGEYEVVGGNGVLGYTNKYNVDGITIAIGRVGAKCGNVHLLNYKLYVNDNAMIIKPFKIVLPEYLSILLESMNLNTLSTASAQPLLTSTSIKNQFIAISNIIEQNRILLYIKTELSTIDVLISKYQKQIDLMQEYRTSLISQAVTGKIDVRESV